MWHEPICTGPVSPTQLFYNACLYKLQYTATPLTCFVLSTLSAIPRLQSTLNPALGPADISSCFQVMTAHQLPRGATRSSLFSCIVLPPVPAASVTFLMSCRHGRVLQWMAPFSAAPASASGPPSPPPAPGPSTSSATTPVPRWTRHCRLFFTSSPFWTPSGS